MSYGKGYGDYYKGCSENRLDLVFQRYRIPYLKAANQTNQAGAREASTDIPGMAARCADCNPTADVKNWVLGFDYAVVKDFLQFWQHSKLL